MICHRLQTRIVSLAISCFALFAGVGATGANAKSNEARLEREFKLRVGQQVLVKKTNLRIRFVVVENDSRCPKDVTCVWAGNAAVQLQLGAGRGRKTVTLNTSNSPSFGSETEYQGYKIRLVGLSPYPRSNRKIQRRDYTATLLVSKA